MLDRVLAANIIYLFILWSIFALSSHYYFTWDFCDGFSLCPLERPKKVYLPNIGRYSHHVLSDYVCDSVRMTPFFPLLFVFSSDFKIWNKNKVVFCAYFQTISLRLTVIALFDKIKQHHIYSHEKITSFDKLSWNRLDNLAWTIFYWLLICFFHTKMPKIFVLLICNCSFTV